MTKIGFIGLGIMGGPMAGHLIDAGNESLVKTFERKEEEIAQ